MHYIICSEVRYHVYISLFVLEEKEEGIILDLLSLPPIGIFPVQDDAYDEDWNAGKKHCHVEF